MFQVRKAVTTHVKKYRIFSCVLIKLISCLHVTRLWRHSVRFMNERRNLHDLQVVSRDFLELWWLKHQKIRIADRQSDSNFPSREGNQYTKRKTESCVFRGVCVSFLTAENENRQLEDLSPADFGRLPERLLLSVRTKSINENFVN